MLKHDELRGELPAEKRSELSAERRGALSAERRGAPPQVPPPTRALERALAEQAAYRAGRAGLEQRSMVRGLVLLAMIVLVATVLRAGVHNVFLPGWWRHW